LPSPYLAGLVEILNNPAENQVLLIARISAKEVLEIVFAITLRAGFMVQ
jgi:hypothetical protein